MIDLERNPKQRQLVETFLLEIAKIQKVIRDAISKNIRPEDVKYQDGKRIGHYGGAVRGGKTIADLSIGVLLGRAFPGTRTHVIRANFPDIERTVFPSLEKVIPSSWRWRKQQGDYYVEQPNGSRLYFMAENFKQDKDLNRFKGLETNFFILEQLEELQEATYNKCLERVGSYKVDGIYMPPGMILTNFNPTWNWVKSRIYEPALRDELPEDEIWIQALPDDNPWVGEDQWKQWRKMDPESYDRFIRGIWDLDVEGAFFNSFSKAKHVRKGLEYDPAWELWVSFDFNVDPMTCIVFQTDGRSFFRVLREYRVADSNTPELCDHIREDWIIPHRPMIRVTGDATGQNRLSGIRGALSQYQVIMDELRLDPDDFIIPNANPGIADSRAYANSVLTWLEGLEIDESCEFLIQDLQFLQKGLTVDGKVTKQRTGVNKYTNLPANQMGHLADTFRYGLHVGLPDFVQLHRS